MAFDITRKRIVNPAEAVGFSFTAGKTSGSTVDFGGEDEKTVILFNNTGSNAGTATIEAGDGIQGVSDLTVNVPVGFSAIVLESGACKKLTGSNKGAAVIKVSATTIGIAAVELR